LGVKISGALCIATVLGGKQRAPRAKVLFDQNFSFTPLL
jgi:hypothetical protein